MNRVFDLPIGARERAYLIAILLDGTTGVTATVTSVPEFVAVTGGPILALTAETTLRAS
jgi:hypothetical protein